MRSGIPEKYWDLAWQYRDELIRQAFAILGSLEDAEDVVQETFCAAFKDTSKISPESIGASLRLINKTNALDRLRSRSRGRQRDQASTTKSFTTGGFSGIELRESIEKALTTLPEQMRTVVRLRYFEQLSYKEIAQRLNLPIGTIGPLLSEAVLHMYAQFAPGQANKAQPEEPGNTERPRKSSRRFRST